MRSSKLPVRSYTVVTCLFGLSYLLSCTHVFGATDFLMSYNGTDGIGALIAESIVFLVSCALVLALFGAILMTLLLLLLFAIKWFCEKYGFAEAGAAEHIGRAYIPYQLLLASFSLGMLAPYLEFRLTVVSIAVALLPAALQRIDDQRP